MTPELTPEFTPKFLLTGAALPQNNDASAQLTTANGKRLLPAQPDSVANHVTARSMND